MAFKPDFLGAMRTCILALIWPKKEIYSFFSQHGCEEKDLLPIKNYADPSTNRAAMVDLVFGQLTSRPDKGLGPLRAMLQSLLNWSHFDPYYFDKLKKLNVADAKRSIEHLKQLQELRDGQVKAERARRESAQSQQQKAKQTLEEVSVEYLSLHAGSVKPQQRGYALERVLSELAKLSSLEVTEPFRVNGEQVDGAVKFDGEHYLIEAKWQDAAAANEAVYQFAGKVDGKMYGRGLIISVHGFSDHVVKAIVHGKSLKTIFVDGHDMMLVIDGQLSFSQMIDRKVKAGQTRGLIYVDPISGDSKQRI